ncbi:MAG: DUF4912 domain-containing protein [Candidatus Saganbacteria bacterium]|nr:DUF4912 domain-containing protein [Candidatus Saganbacteria bacterium]
MAESSKPKRTRAKSAAPKKMAAPKAEGIKKPRQRKTQKKVSPVVQQTEKSVQNIPQEKSRVEESKYYAGPVIQKFFEDKGYELPAGYGDARITLMVRDPYWIHAYWELADWKLEELKSMMGHDNFSRSKKMLRVYDVTDIKFTGVNANKSYDIDVSHDARNWYINPGDPNRSYCVDIGFLDPHGKFFVAARSNVVSTPRDSMSDVIDEEWLTIDWERMYALSGGFGIGKSSGEIKELLKKRLREEMSSGFMGWSGSITARPEKAKDFWLVANTELIVYGATEPDAKVSIQGLPVKLRHDGTFSMRFALPDGRQEIPIEAISRDGNLKRSIHKTVEKRTK